MTTRAAAVIEPQDLPWEPAVRPPLSLRRVVDRRRNGCLSMIMRILRCESGETDPLENPESDDVLFVRSGLGIAQVGEQELRLEPGCGLLAPAGTPYRLRSLASQPLEIVSVLSPQPGRAEDVPPSQEAGPPSRLLVRESDEELLEASPERHFKLLIDPRLGARFTTQFLGWVEKSKAEPHRHYYEEVICILEGEGLVHIESGTHSIRSGSCIYLPSGAEHVVENPNPEPLKLLGVFSPAGSPANRY